MPAKVASLKQKEVPASIWKRGLAYLIDAFIVSIAVGMPLNKLINIQSDNVKDLMQLFNSNPSIMYKIFFISLISAFLSILYWAYLEYKYTQSIGKYFMKINVRSLAKNLTFSQCFMRNITKLSTLILLIDALPLFLGKSTQRYFEKFSNTKVVEKGWVI
ncbi:RDD family protein [Candidatus Woesearchaeota archaeon]|nr:MAG: RDD family protein [Candidatus Woesearchaeota archaeon]